MNFCLDNYPDFHEEQEILAEEARKKDELLKQLHVEEREDELRFSCLSDCFVRLSWYHKKQFILSIIKNINCFDTLVRISYIGTLYGKLAAYSDVSPQSNNVSDQILVDHDRAMEESCFKEVMCSHLNWLATLPNPKLIIMILDLVRMAGGSLVRKLYIPIVNIYNQKLLEIGHSKTNQAQKDLQAILNIEDPDDSTMYPQEHPLTLEVEKMRKKWEEIIQKYRREVFEVKADSETPTKKPKKAPSKKAKKNTKATTSQAMDWVQMLPIWIVKTIFNYLDLKTLQSLKKVNPYWAYVCDSVIKDRQARTLLDQTIEKFSSKVDPEVLKQCLDNSKTNRIKTVDHPREKRLKGLLNRGAVLPSLRPKVKKSQQVRWAMVNTLSKGTDIVDPIDKVIPLPRLIKEDLLLYKKYPCLLKDVNVALDVEESVKRQDTLSYTLTQLLSDAFSVSESDLADW